MQGTNARNKATVQDGRVVVQDVRGRYNANNQGRPFQRNNARGNVVAGNVGGQNRGGIICEPVPTATVVNAPIVSTNTSVSTTIAQDAHSTSHSLSSSQVHPPIFPQGVAAGPTIKDTLIT
ncbi:hypothetical protein Tco_0136459 [Tanacetum coccineum]